MADATGSAQVLKGGRSGKCGNGNFGWGKECGRVLSVARRCVTRLTRMTLVTRMARVTEVTRVMGLAKVKEVEEKCNWWQRRQ